MGSAAQLNRIHGQWVERHERGSGGLIRLTVAICRTFGREFARFCLLPVAAYFTFFGGTAVAASRDFWRRLGQTGNRRQIFRHMRTFIDCIVDRVFFLLGDFDRYEFIRTGSRHLADLERSGRGAILIGAHVGSFEAMRSLSREKGFRINIVVHFENARRINAVFREINPAFMARVIEIRPGDPSYIFQIQERIDAGELVAILGDRVGLGERSVRVPFLGEPASFPVGPYTLAAALGCPVFAVFGLYQAPRRYRLFCKPFAPRVRLPRGERAAGLRDLAARYAARLEYYVRLAPHNWFNFYDFWAPPK